MKSDMAALQLANKFALSGPVFFYGSEKTYQHLSVCIAEGFKELGIPFYSNINYWQIAPNREDYLFCNDSSVIPDDCSIVVLSHQWFNNNFKLPENLFHPKRKYITVYLDDMDGPTIWNPEFRDFDFILRTHYNSKAQQPSNCLPWIFGLSNRILRETSELPNFQERSRKLIVNFRTDQEVLEVANSWLKVDQGLLRVFQGVVYVDRPIRKIVRQQFLPLIDNILAVDDTADSFDSCPSDSYHYLQWVQTGSRHYPTYYQRLKSAVACACFGGCIASSSSGEERVEWWDSWRFWESLAAGCVTFHVDFDKYGIQLPVMPQNWQHYIGIDLDNLEETVDRLANQPEILEHISTSGRQWAIENYGPIPTALRFLETITTNPSRAEISLLQKDYAATVSLPITLRERNLIIFPDWSSAEESLSLELERVIRAVVAHPEKSQITLLIYTSNISEDDANLMLSSVIMNLLMQEKEDLDLTEGPDISLISELDELQWSLLLPCLQARIILPSENKQAIASAKAERLQSFSIDSLNN